VDRATLITDRRDARALVVEDTGSAAAHLAEALNGDRDISRRETEVGDRRHRDVHDT
jgi:hypothetical protein